VVEGAAGGVEGLDLGIGAMKESMAFIGVDMAWKIDGNHSGVAVLEGNARGARLVAHSDGLLSQEAIIEYIKTHAKRNTVLAIDASLIVNNATGQRACERLIGQAIGLYGASCHSTSRNRRYWETGPRLVKELKNLGFSADFDLANTTRRPGRWLFEVYPHPAMVRMFRLDSIIRYKKGSVPKKREGLATLRQHLERLAADEAGELGSPPLLRELLSRDLALLRGEAMKRYQDTLDAVFCAYLASLSGVNYSCRRIASVTI